MRILVFWYRVPVLVPYKSLFLPIRILVIRAIVVPVSVWSSYVGAVENYIIVAGTGASIGMLAPGPVPMYF